MSRVRTGAFVLGGLLVALLLAGVVSNFAAESPDGLEATARQGCTVNDAGEITGGSCVAQAEKEHEVGGPLAGYGIRGIDNGHLSGGLAGVAGVLLTFALGGGLFWVARRRRPTDGAPVADHGAPTADHGPSAPDDAAPRDGTSAADHPVPGAHARDGG